MYALLLALALACAADDELRLVTETYDAVWVIHEKSVERSWEVSRLLFIRNGRVIADRIVNDDMQWSIDRGEFVVCWNDYGQCNRAVRFRVLIEVSVNLDEDGPTDADKSPWWGMGRRMTNLAAPD